VDLAHSYDDRAPERLRALIEAIPAITYVCEWDEQATLRYISPQLERIMGFPPEAWLELRWVRYLHPDDRDAVLAEIRRTFRAEVPFDMEYRMVAADGRTVWLWDREAIVRDAAGKPVLSQGVLIDVTARKETEQALQAERDRAQGYLDIAGALILVADPDGTISLANREFEGVLGYTPDELVGRPFPDLVPPSEREACREAIRRLARGEDGETRHEGIVLTKDGHERIVSWRSRALRDEGGAVVGSLHSGQDVTDRRAAEEQVAYLAYHDALTGLPNRALLREHLDLAVARGRRHGRSVALLYLDLNNFKLVNDSLGHAAGDELLQRIAERLRAATRASDLLARHGGDEFLLLLTDLDGTGAGPAEAAAANLAQALEEPFHIQGAEFQVGAAVGISLFPADAEDPDRLLQHADAAMYQAKRSERASLALYASRSGDPLERLSLTARLRRALERDELELHYQPIVRLADGVVTRREALLRWREPDRGLLLPADYLPVAEDTGLIEPIGDWALAELCRQGAAWRDAGQGVPLAFNVSPLQLRRRDFAARVESALAAHDLKPELVCVEIAESGAMPVIDRIEPVLRELRTLGLSVAFDDFGAGYSSLHRLRGLPVDILKIDRSFLRDVGHDAQARATVEAIVRLAAALGMEAVAEGVETDVQRRFLVEAGCRLGQGFVFGRPRPAWGNGAPVT
jgi:diguanylate cyclase (GGDEF)-like protein/PAS domain S-box-containing protein